MTGIEITARYQITCDDCGVCAEPDEEYRTYAAAVAARARIAEFDGWLLRPHQGAVCTLLCPECAAKTTRRGRPISLYPVS